ncbi:hypothetical protein Q5H80_03025 [Vibrio sp. SNU_ST1]|uniref:hypothetical protein n=1 Tax=Vibrio sp. SNU_ST1 TaxID=3064001 RepID=UPI00272D8C0C|nr:hypothetical protein [Vibrio sp. SNU_ST1]WKY58638.1 hypothetical protein Q5H80_03025 [Vibrio sp. SNU_ST1]
MDLFEELAKFEKKTNKVTEMNINELRALAKVTTKQVKQGVKVSVKLRNKLVHSTTTDALNEDQVVNLYKQGLAGNHLDVKLESVRDKFKKVSASSSQETN